MADECFKCHKPTQGHVLVNNDGLCNMCYDDLSKRVLNTIIENTTNVPIIALTNTKDKK